MVDKEGNNMSRECTTQHEIFDAARSIMIDHFSGAFSLPFYSDRLFNDLGFMGDSGCAQQALEGTCAIS
jgi:hypothetical protein